jgi:hypothetical protein
MQLDAFLVDDAHVDRAHARLVGRGLELITRPYL